MRAQGRCIEEVCGDEVKPADGFGGASSDTVSLPTVVEGLMGEVVADYSCDSSDERDAGHERSSRSGC